MPMTAEGVTLIGLGITNMGVMLKILVDLRKNGKNGTAKMCTFHGKIESRIVAVETEKEAIVEKAEILHSENRQEHQILTKGISDLSVSVAVASESARTAAAAAATAAIAATAATAAVAAVSSKPRP